MPPIRATTSSTSAWPGAITGTVLEDLDHDGTGDTPIAGVTVVLKDASGAPIASTTTDANGNYSFANVPAGNYTVEQTNAPGYTDVSDIDGGNPNSIAVSLQPGQSSTGNDFVDERPATLGDRVWLDTNANGVQDAGETGLAGVTVQLKNADGSVAQTATTDANGNYSFTVNAGTYSVAVVAPAGYVVTGQDLGGDEALDSDIDAAGQSAQVTLSSGQNNPNVDAGLYKLAELGDRVWFDSNGNGQQDTGEAGAQGVKVTLLDASGNPVGASLTTDVDGNSSSRASSRAPTASSSTRPRCRPATASPPPTAAVTRPTPTPTAWTARPSRPCSTPAKATAPGTPASRRTWVSTSRSSCVVVTWLKILAVAKVSRRVSGRPMRPAVPPSRPAGAKPAMGPATATSRSLASM
ncbi:MAG: carboxypeptidase regulatory-like domain-containing protein [Zoogloea sp.]|nr:carboxypeptidase regulatory-like domain-containing protein [Zoogloea sp.]